MDEKEQFYKQLWAEPKISNKLLSNKAYNNTGFIRYAIQQNASFIQFARLGKAVEKLKQGVKKEIMKYF